MKTTTEVVVQDALPTTDETLKVRISRVRVSTRLKGGECPPGEGRPCVPRLTAV